MALLKKSVLVSVDEYLEGEKHSQDTVRLESIDFELPLAEVYRDVAI